LVLSLSFPLLSPVSLSVLQSAIESLFGASLTGVAYSLFAGQPLTILGSTGPVLVFEKILFKFCT
jgi:sodium bicarbonate cotransporter 7